MLEFWCFVGVLFTIAFIISIITTCICFTDGEIPGGVVALIVIFEMISILSWSQVNCINKYDYIYDVTDKQEKVIEMLAEITGEDKSYIAGVVLLCDEELSIAEMAMAIDGDITLEDAKGFERIAEMRLKELDNKN